MHPKWITFARAKLLEFHILELKILSFLIQYKFQTYGHFLYYELLHVILMPKKLKGTIQKFISFLNNAEWELESKNKSIQSPKLLC